MQWNHTWKPRSTFLQLLVLVPLLGLESVEIAFAEGPTLVARWDFSAEEVSPLTVQGHVLRDQPGPLPPEFPDFPQNNTAVRFQGDGSYLSIQDPGDESPFDFTNGDAISLEAWVNVEQIREGQPEYIIGKGRTGAPQFHRDNQNWSMRIVGSGGKAKISFLFATQPGPGEAHWHRWTSEAGFYPEAGWHHLAVSYRFGEPESMRGWIDGQQSSGTWDIGGKTKETPVVDNDAIWIGSSMGGNRGSTFHGSLDAIAIHRTLFDDALMLSRFRRVGEPRLVGPLPEVMPELLDIPPGQVVVSLAEGLPTHERWLNMGEMWPQETARWHGDSFLLPRIPLRYDDWGIRAAWKAPVHLRIAGDVALPAGKHKFLLRSRALGRLWINGELIARTMPLTKQPPNGEEPITPLVEPPYPTLRPAGYRQQEVFGEATIPASATGEPQLSRVVLELVVGGKNLRTETGEVCVAIESPAGETYHILTAANTTEQPLESEQAGRPLLFPLTSIAVEPELKRIENSLAMFDDENRRRAATSQHSYWEQRHQLAQDWVSKSGQPKIPEVSKSAAKHPIDAFLQHKIETALQAAQQTDPTTAKTFHEDILPILRENCFRCHGEKDKGGLKLNSRENALKLGDSEVPAIVPGDAAASELVARISSNEDGLRMPPTGPGLSPAHIKLLKDWIQQGALWPAPPLTDADVAVAPVINDESFLRRIYLDTVGVPPTVEEARKFLADHSEEKRDKLIRLLLQDDRFADHWVSYWMDQLAENPTLLNASLNSTGPFRWFLLDSLRDGKSLDRMVTELLLMRGDPHEGGSAGFAIAAENDSPFAAKGHIIAAAFLGIDLQCARCHDSPYHSTTQRDLYSLAAMLNRKSVTVPKTSRVPAAFFEKQSRESLIRVTLKPDEPVAAEWPFHSTTGASDGPALDGLLQNPQDSRERLALLITTPENRRFAQVVVNRLWKRLVGAGFVEPEHDWEGRDISHPELLNWLALELVENNYDVRHIIGLILTSDFYQRDANGRNATAPAEFRFFNSPDRRRMTAEQVVDALHVVTGKSLDVEELTFVHDGRRPISNRLTLGKPSRAWMLGDLKNERDRPSLSLPKARTVADVLEAFGWSGSRQKPIHYRETEPNVLQPGILENGILSATLTRASYQSSLADLAVTAESPESLVEVLFLQVLSRTPRPDEREVFTNALAEDFERRLMPADQIIAPPEHPALPQVTWFNHGQSEANTIQQELERRVSLGPPPDPRLRNDWREVYEDVLWSLINHREFVWIP